MDWFGLKYLKLREYVDDTEDYINIMLDDKQNQLLQMGVVLSTVTLLVTSAVVVTAIFGTNIHITLYRITDLNVFWEAVGGTLAGVATLFLGAMLYYWKNGILR
jgi:magnesium transporter